MFQRFSLLEFFVKEKKGFKDQAGGMGLKA
jgi:hypothetical protein